MTPSQQVIKVVAATYHAKSCDFVLNIKMRNYSVLKALTISLNAHCLRNGLQFFVCVI